MPRPTARGGRSKTAAPRGAALSSTVKASSGSAFHAQGVHGWASYGGHVRSRETHADLIGQTKYKTFANLIQNTVVVATALRYYLSLLTKPSWTFEPADDSPLAAEYAELVAEMITKMRTPWRRVVRKAGMYRFLGFSVAERIAMRRADGKIGLADIAARPQFTITKFHPGADGEVAAFTQHSPQDGRDLVLDRARVLYLVDDAVTDAPDGSGLLRHVVSAAKRLTRYEQLEGYVFETDMRGIPIIHGPFAALAADDSLTTAEKAAVRAPLDDFCDGHIRGKDNSLQLDSEPYKNPDGSWSSVPRFRVELLRGDGGGQVPLRDAIRAINHEMARVLGAEGLMIGEGSSGNRSTSSEKAAQAQMNVEGALAEIAEGVDRDVIAAIGAWNGWKPELLPKAKTSSLQMRDIEQVAAAMRDLATAGVTLDRGDEAVGEMFDQLGLSRLKVDELREEPMDIRTQTPPKLPGDDDEPTDEDDLPEKEAA